MSDHKSSKSLIHYLPVYGCIATGIIYGGIGVIAMLSFLKIRQGGADESSMMLVLNDFVAGKILIWVILTGTVSYIIWRVYEAITDPYGYGRDARGLGKRTGIALSTVADMVIVFAAVKVLLGTGNIQADGKPYEERQMVETLIAGPGSWIVIAFGIIILLTAGVQLWYGITRGYKERIDIAPFPDWIEKIIHALAWMGYGARAVIIGIVGFFFTKAGIAEDPDYVVNTDKAFDFVGDHVGHVWFVILAIGTFCYGLFMLAQGVAYDADKG